jgi:hypothetical protein
VAENSPVRRISSPLVLATALAVTWGVVSFVWSAADFGSSCGLSTEQPNGVPFAIFVCTSAVLIGIYAAIGERRWPTVLAWSLFGAAVACVAIFVAMLIFAFSRHCFD